MLVKAVRSLAQVHMFGIFAQKTEFIPAY